MIWVDLVIFDLLKGLLTLKTGMVETWSIHTKVLADYVPEASVRRKELTLLRHLV